MKSAFPPVVSVGAKILILGSMPSEASLAAGQYYAHPRNAFWPIMGELIGAKPELPYRQRLNYLKQNGIALWDVLAACERQGSLDSAINQKTLIANDFIAFIHQYKNIKQIYFNGKSVEALFKRHVLKQQPINKTLQMTVLPSTSPANARLTFADKLQAWQIILTSL